VYGSGGFTTYDAARTREPLGRWAGDLGIPRVKIKVGEAWGTRESRDLRRLELAREIVGGGVELYADANGAYSAKQAIRVARQAADVDLRWFEEPVSSDANGPTPSATASARGPDVRSTGPTWPAPGQVADGRATTVRMRRATSSISSTGRIGSES
jgi:hypothetical protein